MYKGNPQYTVTADQFERYIDHIIKCFADFCGYPPTKREIRQIDVPLTSVWKIEINGDKWGFDDMLFILRNNGDINPKWLRDWQKHDRDTDFYIDMWHWCGVAESLGNKYTPSEVIRAIYGNTLTFKKIQLNKNARELMDTFKGRFLFRINNGTKRVKKICVFLAKQYNKITKLFSKK